jgi:hypothetical protein
MIKTKQQLLKNRFFNVYYLIFILILFIKCSSYNGIEYSTIEKWEKDNIAYVNACCRDSSISKSYLIFFIQRNHFIQRNRLELLNRINEKVGINNKTFIVIERLVLEDPKEYIYVWDDKKNEEVFSFQYLSKEDTLVSFSITKKKSKRLTSYDWKEEMLAAPCCSEFPRHTSFDIYSKLKIKNKKLILLESYVSPPIW